MCGWEVLSGVCHWIYAVFLLLKKVVEYFCFREECAFKGDSVGTTLSSHMHGTEWCCVLTPASVLPLATTANVVLYTDHN